MTSITMPFGIDDLDQLFILSELLDNKEELVKDFKPEIQKFLVKSDFFSGHTKRLYNEAFDELVLSLIKKQIIKHFPAFTPEEILLLIDKDLISVITNNYYFNQDIYRDV